MTGQEIYILIKEHRPLLSILGIENYCEIKQGTLNKALDRNQETFKDVSKLKKLLQLNSDEKI